MELLINLLKVVIPTCLALYLVFLIVRQFVGAEQKKVETQLRLGNAQQALPLRLQAMERMSIFLERISPASLAMRYNNPELTAAEMKHLIVHEVREEFQHNLSQQIYMSTSTWNMIKKAMEEIIALVNDASQNLPPNANGRELQKKLIDQVIQHQTDYVSEALITLRQEAHSLF